MNVLVVEDDDGVREVMTDLFADSAHVRPVQSVADALAALDAESFDLIFADLRIRGTSDGGKQMVAAARRFLSPVVIMTGLQREEMRRMLGGLVPDGMLLKPFAIEEALAVFNRFSKLRHEVETLGRLASEATDWRPVTASLRMSGKDADAHTGKRLLEWTAGAAEEVRTFPTGQVGRVLRGKISIDGQGIETGRPFFLSAEQPYAIGSVEGAVVALVSLPEAR